MVSKAKVIAVVVTLMVCMHGGASWAKGFCSGERIAVYPFKGTDGEETAVLLTTFLGESTELRLLERSQLDNAMKEIKLSYSDLFDGQQALRLGKFLNARCLVVGEINRNNGALTATARVMNTETGELVTAASEQTANGDLYALTCHIANSLHSRIADGNLKDCPNLAVVNRPEPEPTPQRTAVVMQAPQPQPRPTIAINYVRATPNSYMYVSNTGGGVPMPYYPQYVPQPMARPNAGPGCGASTTCYYNGGFIKTDAYGHMVGFGIGGFNPSNVPNWAK